MQSLARAPYLLFATVAWAEILRVPSEYATIQSALDASVQNDTVLVAPGTYAEQLRVDNATVLLKGDVVTDTGSFEMPGSTPHRCLIRSLCCAWT